MSYSFYRLVHEAMNNSDLIQNYEASLLTMQNMSFIVEEIPSQSLDESSSESKKSYKRSLEYSGSEHEDLDNL